MAALRPPVRPKWRSTRPNGHFPEKEGGVCLDFFDVSACLSDFSAGDPAADLTGDGVLDFFDLSRFIVDFGRGCDLF